MKIRFNVFLLILTGILIMGACTNRQSKPMSINEVVVSYHEKGHENAWIKEIDRESGLVRIATIDSRMSIVFKPSVDKLENFRVNWIAPVTFQCEKRKAGKCDLSKPYKLYVSNVLVEPVEVSQ